MDTKRYLLLGLCVVAISVTFISCSSSKKVTGSSGSSTLREAYKNDFLIGTALNSQQIEEKDSNAAKLVPEQFSAATPENIMKAEIIHPQWDKYNFDLADKMVEYGKKHNILINGHTLIWHSQLPAYARNIKDVDSFKTFFNNHITTIASRYNGKMYSWDVVNEELNEDGTMRKSIFLDKLGDDFITEAFRLAQKAAPDTKLYYNDYNIEQPKKRAGAIAIIKKIQAAGVRIDGVGIQGHWHLNKVPFKEIEESIQQFSALGIKVMFTELDIEVLKRDFQGADVSQRVASISSSVNITFIDRKSTRLNSSHTVISYAVFCLKKKNKKKTINSRRRMANDQIVDKVSPSTVVVRSYQPLLLLLSFLPVYCLSCSIGCGSIV